MRCWAFAVFLLSAFSVPLPVAWAADETDSTLIRALDGQPGVEIVRGEAGGVAFTEWHKGGVFYRLEKRSSGDVLLGDDESGAGAVLCTYEIYAAARDALATCPVDSFAVLRADIDRDLPAMERFIVDNSVLPVTIASLHAQADARRVRNAASTLPGQAPICTGASAGGIVGALDAAGAAERQALIAKLLAVPRWPVLNPCL